MPNKNDYDDFDRISDVFENNSLSSTYYRYIDFSTFNENECPKTSKNNIYQSESCCYSKLSSMDLALKNMHKRWSMID